MTIIEKEYAGSKKIEPEGNKTSKLETEGRK